ncbi:MAG: HAD-IC family P-type ATPase, partial [Clostridiales bacterium]|nr:HAD-IC family P-type ATPase [Clostridiales bacterium]
NEQIEITRYNPGIAEGLNGYQLEERTASGLINNRKIAASKSVPVIILANVFTFFNMLILALAAIMIAFAKFEQMLFVAIALINLFIGTFQEIRAKLAVEKLSLVTAPKALVIRSGREQAIPISEIALDDILIIDYGKQVSCDCKVLNGSVEVNESLLTGESVSVKKGPGDILLGGSFISSGKAYARVEHINADNYVAQLTIQAKKYKKPVSPLLKSMRNIIKVIGFIIIPLGAATFATSYLRSAGGAVADPVESAFVATAGSMVGMIPSGMFLLTSVALYVSQGRLARHKALIQEMYCIEMLARVDTLCLDKTGTITDGSMRVKEVIKLSGMRYDLGELIGSYQAATLDNNQTAHAIGALYPHNNTYKAVRILPFSSARKYSAVMFHEIGTFALGAPEFMIHGLDRELAKRIDRYSAQGLRVLMLARSARAISKDGELPPDMAPALLLLIEDNIRPDAPQTIRWFVENNVNIRIISGDNPVTVSEIAARVGVAGAERYVSLEGLSIPEVIAIADKYIVYGRVTPEQKAALVKAMKAQGHTVAMTGDGVNDILALREADCAIAMAEGSEAARKVSQLVLMNNSFASMPQVVSEGRRVINNIQKSSALYLMKTIFTIAFTVLILSLGSVLNITTYPLQTNHMMILEILVIGGPSFFLALQPNTKRLEGKFIVNLFLNATPAALTLLLNATAVLIYFAVAGRTPPDLTGANELATLLVLSITCAGVLMLFRMCLPFTKITTPIFVSMTAMIILIFALSGIPALSALFAMFAIDISTLTAMDFMFFFIIIQASNSVYIMINMLITRSRNPLNLRAPQKKAKNKRRG